MLLYADPIFLDHDTGNHPECAARLVSAEAELSRSGLMTQCQRPVWQPASDEQIARLHDPDYTDRLRSLADSGGGRIETDTVVSNDSFSVAQHAAGAVCDAVARVITGEDRRALCLVRPPGHHALPRGAMGFCLLNNVAIAARMALAELDVERLLLVDWDVHHGNGTQDMFWEDSRVGFFSIHRWPFYPGTGESNETGTGDGLGATMNIPIEFGTSRKDYLDQFRLRLESFATKIRPQLILVSAGFDSHRLDPVGSLGLEREDFASLTQCVMDLADSHCKGRIVSVLEGGYNVDVLGQCIATHLSTMLEY